MRTHPAVELLSPIAVPAEGLESRRKVVFDDPPVNPVASKVSSCIACPFDKGLPVKVTATIYVVDVQKV
jgi:hypothetical protein